MKKPVLSIIMPLYNEEKTIKKIYKEVLKSKPKDKEIIIIDDCSTDNSYEIIKQNISKKTKLIKHKKNKGKGAAIKTGLKYVKGEITIFQDADSEYNPNEIIKCIKPIMNKETNVVYGSRFLNKKNKKNRFYYGNKLLSRITSILYNRKITDMETCYKAIKTQLLKNLDLKSNGFGIEPEITSKIMKKRQRIIEIPISYKPRTKKQGKKIKTKDGIKAVYFLLRYKLF